jgi:hypothetical protein
MLRLKDSKVKKQKMIIVSPTMYSYIYHPNKVTNAVYNFSLIQERLLNAFIFYLQDTIKEHWEGHNYTRMNLFQEFKNGQIDRIKIPLKEIYVPQNYARVIESIKELASLIMDLSYRHEYSKNNCYITQGLSGQMFKKNKRTSHIEVEIDGKVVNLMVKIKLNNKRNPLDHSRIAYVIARHTLSKYTSQIYKLICFWKKEENSSVCFLNFEYGYD